MPVIVAIQLASQWASYVDARGGARTEENGIEGTTSCEREREDGEESMRKYRLI